jgi:membrane-associated phospholipid phosphatase
MRRKASLKRDLFKALNSLKEIKTLPLTVTILLCFIIIILSYFRSGAALNFIIDMVLLIAISLTAFFGKSNKFLSNFAICIILLLTYEVLRSFTGGIVSTENLFPLASIDNGIFGFNFTGTVQKAFFSPAATLVATLIYGIHLPLVMTAIILFFFKDFDLYRGYTYTLILTSFLALLTFAIFPTAPPWLSGTASNLLPDGYKILLGPYSSSFQASVLADYDKFAAFPSLHMAYTVIFFVYALRLNRKFGIIAFLLLPGMFFSTIYLGQHYVIDLVAGIAYSLAGFIIIERIMHRAKSTSRTPSKS